MSENSGLTELQLNWFLILNPNIYWQQIYSIRMAYLGGRPGTAVQLADEYSHFFNVNVPYELLDGTYAVRLTTISEKRTQMDP